MFVLRGTQLALLVLAACAPVALPVGGVLLGLLVAGELLMVAARRVAHSRSRACVCACACEREGVRARARV